MDYIQLECKRCGASISYRDGTNHLRCQYCGAEYVMKSRPAQGDDLTQIPYQNRGCLFRAAFPQDWSWRIFDDENCVSESAAVCKGLRLQSPEGAQLILYPFAYFKDCHSQRNYQVQMPGMERLHARPASVEDYICTRIREIFPDSADIRCTALNDLDAQLTQRCHSFAPDAAAKLKAQPQLLFGKYLVGYLQNGKLCCALFATVLALTPTSQASSGNAPAGQPTKGQPTKKKKFSYGEFYRSGGLLGKWQREGKLNVPGVDFTDTSLKGSLKNLGTMAVGLNKLTMGMMGGGIPDWGRFCDAVMLFPGEPDAALNAAFNRFCASFDYGPVYYALQEEEMRMVQQIQINGMRQRQQNAMAAQQQLSRTLNETSDTISAGYWERSARMDDVYRRSSEAVRGVNSYEDLCGRRVEADVSYEHVYQRGSDYAGSASHSPDAPYDWVELNKID